MRRRLLSLLFLFVVGCQIGEIEHAGTITYVEDGGFWGIVTEDGDRFVPENLPVEFEHEGMVIEFEGYVVDEDRAEGEWGIPVLLNEIEVSLDGHDD